MVTPSPPAAFLPAGRDRVPESSIDIHLRLMAEVDVNQVQ